MTCKREMVSHFLFYGRSGGRDKFEHQRRVHVETFDAGEKTPGSRERRAVLELDQAG